MIFRKSHIKATIFLNFLISFWLVSGKATGQTCEGASSVLDACGVCTGGSYSNSLCKDLSAGRYLVVSKSSGLCLQDATNVTQETKSETNAKIWEVTKVGSYYTLKNVATNQFLSLTTEPTSYVLSTFKGDNNAGMKLSTYRSEDGLNFNLISDTGYEGTSSNLRDPSIMLYKDGKYYVAYTTAPTESCCGSQDHFSIATSTDLIKWTHLVTIPAGISNATHTWAPEWYIEGNTVRIIASIETGDWQFRAYMFTAKNEALTSWSGAQSMGIGPNYIDTYVIKEGNTYHAFTKNETTKYLEHATAPGLTGPWKFIATGNWSGWGSGVEGNNIVRLSSGGFRIFFDSQGTPFKYADSKDLTIWTAAKNVPGIYNVARHGTVINLSLQPPLSGTGVVSETQSPSTLWRLEKGDGNSYVLVPVLNYSLALDITNASTLPGTKLIVYNRNNDLNQQFDFIQPAILGLEENNRRLNSERVSPNPFVNELKIESADHVNYFIHNSEGKLMESGSGSGAFFVGRNLAKGCYSVQLINSHTSNFFKVIKQ